MFYWKIKEFKTYYEMKEWEEKHKDKYQMRQVFINNAYALEYRDLIKL